MKDEEVQLEFDVTVRHTANENEPSPTQDDISTLLCAALETASFRDVEVIVRQL